MKQYYSFLQCFTYENGGKENGPLWKTEGQLQWMYIDKILIKITPRFTAVCKRDIQTVRIRIWLHLIMLLEAKLKYLCKVGHKNMNRKKQGYTHTHAHVRGSTYTKACRSTNLETQGQSGRGLATEEAWWRWRWLKLNTGHLPLTVI